MITIDYLKHHSDCIPELAKIWHEVLGQIWVPDVSISRVEENLRNHLNTEQLPLTLVALHEDKPVGMCSLRVNDGIRPELTPWLGSLVVSPTHQKQGIARQIINRTKQEAQILGFKNLYLFAFDPTIPEYYGLLGWCTIGMDEFKGHPVTVMEIML
ncbi:TPA: GNAT family N-acetyltransferase [Legionella pneumophila]|nr:GNAT family N-acetyltransferase [Legionella pneumophila subsp. pneumophila]HAU0214337.1 GNAT family N-acetyltransferase [Legionella pneumophila]HAT8905935.1 GNAT family N-acetyltransferase [Legionella pneumophila subsp. pneumophila]HAU1084043.1 GNAT family N-acetyltransferase [Legionella pneumophila]HAU1118281.1 GNAT family N-acetyltransferase [Legionella pneumophila]